VFPTKGVEEAVPIGDEINKSNTEFYYEGDFVDGYKHGTGRLYEPSGSYFYGYWEYNKPSSVSVLSNNTVGKTIYYSAEEHNWKILEIEEMVLNPSIDFYAILKSSQIDKLPVKAAGYPDFRLDGYKSLIDEKGLKREHFEDPDFDFTEMALNIKDENG